MNGKKKLAILAVAFAGVLGAGLAEARGRDDVQWSVTIGHPSPVFVGPPMHVYGAPVHSYGYSHRSYDRRHGSARWDRDGDGIPNRHDRVYNPRWDRDGDGVPNRYDRVHNPRWDRDGDGIPNRYDRHDQRRHGWDGHRGR